MATFTTIPPEIRNKIYKLHLVRDDAIVVASPYKKSTRVKHNSSDAAILLSVNKQINAEAKTIFFGHNTFVVGDGYWGSTVQANLHGLKHFIAHVPKDCIKLIRHVELELALFEAKNLYWYACGLYNGELDSLVRSLGKYFLGIESIIVSGVEGGNMCGNYTPAPQRAGAFLDEDRGRKGMAKFLHKLLAMPSLKSLSFEDDGTADVRLLMDSFLPRERLSAEEASKVHVVRDRHVPA